VDTYTLYAASAIGAASSFRSLAGFGFPLFASELPPLQDTDAVRALGTISEACVMLITTFYSRDTSHVVSDAMFNKLGLGWGNTLLALVAMSIGIPAPILFYKYGARLRAWSLKRHNIT
ncbi:hypothetical protein FRB95_003064, partial [Tulasnella sp. JGI-2019a]